MKEGEIALMVATNDKLGFKIISMLGNRKRATYLDIASQHRFLTIKSLICGRQKSSAYLSQKKFHLTLNEDGSCKPVNSNCDSI